MAGHSQQQTGHHGHGHGDDHASEAHGGPKLYWIFAVILCLITFFEWLIFEKRLEWGVTNAVLVPSLMGMSLVKFIMVVGWYMHLRYDPGWMRKIFIVSLVMGGGTAAVLWLLMK